MFPDQIKDIDKRDLCRLIATISLGGSEISEALKCLGETSGYIFLPDVFFLLWQAAAGADPDSLEGRRRRFAFSEVVADGIEKIVRDGRDRDEVFRELLFGLTRINEPERLNAVRLICAEFKYDLSQVFLKFRSAEVIEFIEQCIPRGEVKSALEEFNSIKNFDKNQILVRRFLSGLGEVLNLWQEDVRRWRREQDFHAMNIEKTIKACFEDSSVDARGMALSILYGIKQFDEEKISFAISLIVRQKPEIGKVIGREEAEKWAREVFGGNLEGDREDALTLLGFSSIDDGYPVGQPKKEVQADLEPTSLSPRAKWALDELKEICRRKVRIPFAMHGAFIEMDEEDKWKSVQSAVNWAISDMDQDSYYWLRPLGNSSDITRYLANTILHTTYARADANLKYFMNLHKMVRPE